MQKMNRVKEVIKQTNKPYLNMYEFAAERRNGKIAPYYMASRAQQTSDLKALTQECKADGVIIYCVHGEQRDKVVLIKQFRYPLNDYVYEFPAGLVEKNEDMFDAAIREIYEETGLTFEPKKVSEAYSRPYFTTVGMTDEACGTVFGYCNGVPTNAHQEESEDIEVILADKEECKRILREENVAIKCAYMLMHFIHCEGEDPLKFLEEM